jgi:hypothetical protein
MGLAEISITLWFIFFGFSVLFGLTMCKKALNPDIERTQREYWIGIAIFVFIHLIARILYYLYDFIYVGGELFWTWGAIFGIAGLTFLLYAIERNIFTQSKFILTILAIISVLLLIILPADIGSIIQIIILPIIACPIPLIYFYIAAKSTEKIRRNSLLNGLGVLIFLAGQVTHGKFFFESWQPVYFIVAPVLMLIGSIIFFYGLVRKG